MATRQRTALQQESPLAKQVKALENLRREYNREKASVTIAIILGIENSMNTITQQYQYAREHGIFTQPHKGLEEQIRSYIPIISELRREYETSDEEQKPTIEKKVRVRRKKTTTPALEKPSSESYSQYRMVREAVGISKAELARQIGDGTFENKTSLVGNISRWESGKFTPKNQLYLRWIEEHKQLLNSPKSTSEQSSPAEPSPDLSSEQKGTESPGL
jgi:transcriptional regulator with XRE-family HTH domain